MPKAIKKYQECFRLLSSEGEDQGNYLVLMALGGVIATMGFITESPSQQTISLIAAAIIAPGFEPLAKLPVGLGLRRWSVVGTGFSSAGAGYLVLAIAAAVVFVVLHLIGIVTVEEFISNSEVQTLAHPTVREILVSACGAVGGMVMVLSYRRYLVPGALIALAVIEDCVVFFGVASFAKGRSRSLFGNRRVRESWGLQHPRWALLGSCP